MSLYGVHPVADFLFECVNGALITLVIGIVGCVVFSFIDFKRELKGLSIPTMLSLFVLVGSFGVIIFGLLLFTPLIYFGI